MTNFVASSLIAFLASLNKNAGGMSTVSVSSENIRNFKFPNDSTTLMETVGNSSLSNSTVPSVTSVTLKDISTSSSTALQVISVTLMILLATVSLVSNVTTLLVILHTNLRRQFTYIFVTNICLVDVGACILVQPLAVYCIVNQITASSPVCRASNFCFIFLSFLSIHSQCLVSFERFYSISSPMHYSAHLSLAKVLCLIVFIWMAAIAFAMIDIFHWQSADDDVCWPFIPHISSRSVKNDRIWYSSVTILFFYILPGCFIASMYVLIYRVAKRAATKIHPFCLLSTETKCKVTLPSSPSLQTPAAAKNASQTAIREREDIENSAANCNLTSVSIERKNEFLCSGESRKNELKRVNDTELSPSRSSAKSSFICSVKITVPTLHEIKCIDHLKTIRISSTIIVAFLTLWGPLFFARFIPNTGLETLAVWLGCLSFGVNSILYGWMNRAIRDTMSNIYVDIRERFASPNTLQNQRTINESFFEFLERTSVAHPGST